MNLLNVSAKIANQLQPEASRDVGKIKVFQVRIVDLSLEVTVLGVAPTCIKQSQCFLIFKSFLNVCKIVIFINQSPAIFSVIFPYIFIQCCTPSVRSFIGTRVSEIFLWVCKKILGSARPNNCWAKNSQNVRI